MTEAEQRAREAVLDYFEHNPNMPKCRTRNFERYMQQCNDWRAGCLDSIRRRGLTIIDTAALAAKDAEIARLTGFHAFMTDASKSSDKEPLSAEEWIGCYEESLPSPPQDAA